MRDAARLPGSRARPPRFRRAPLADLERPAALSAGEEHSSTSISACETGKDGFPFRLGGAGRRGSDGSRSPPGSDLLATGRPRCAELGFVRAAFAGSNCLRTVGKGGNAGVGALTHTGAPAAPQGGGQCARKCPHRRRTVRSEQFNERRQLGSRHGWRGGLGSPERQNYVAA